MKRLEQDTVERFRRDGLVYPVRVFAPGEASDCLDRLEVLESRRAGRLPPSLNAKPHLLLPWLWDLVFDPRVVDPVEDLLGPDLLCWGSSFVIKNANDPRYVAWHQDATHWGLAAPEAVTIWIALTPSGTENGCVRAIPGSHRAQRLHIDAGDPLNLLGRREEIAEPVDETQAVDMVLRPGEASLHDCLIVHGSEPNLSPARRVGLSLRYVPGNARHTGKERNSATLVRGIANGNFELEDRPEGEFHPAAVARHATVLRRAMSTIFANGSRRLQ